jgi:hypothetical protein
MPNGESEPKGLGKDLDCIKCGSTMRFSCIEPQSPVSSITFTNAEIAEARKALSPPSEISLN